MNLALFDFDGTLTHSESFPDFVKATVRPGRLALGKLLLAPLVIGYRLGWVSGVRVRESIVAFGYRGVPEAALREAGLAFATRALPAVLRPEAMARLRWHQAQGDVVVVVSGAFDLYLAPWCASHGVDLMCSTLEARDGLLTGRYRGPQCVGPEKVRRVRAKYRLEDYPVVYAYGDTREDLDLLELAHRRYYRGAEIPAGAAPVSG